MNKADDLITIRLGKRRYVNIDIIQFLSDFFKVTKSEVRRIRDGGGIHLSFPGKIRIKEIDEKEFSNWN